MTVRGNKAKAPIGNAIRASISTTKPRLNAFQICGDESYKPNNSIFECDSLDRQLVGTNVFENFNSTNVFLTAEKSHYQRI